MLQIRDLTVDYQSKHNSIKALNPISISIKKGDIYVIIGPSGCGKSSLLHVLGGIIDNYSGTVTLNNKILNPCTHSISLIPQNYGLLPWKNVEKNCLLPLNIKNISVDDCIKERIYYILKSLNIETLLHRYPNELSGGERQRVAIARAFIMNPDLLLMDEPFSALDELTREKTQKLFIDIWNKYKLTTVFVTHSIDEALFVGKKIIIMSASPGTIIEVIDNPHFNKCDISNIDYISIKNYIRKLTKKE